MLVTGSLSLLLLTGASCVTVKTQAPAAGVFRSANSGADWITKNTVLTTSGQTKSLATESIRWLKMDYRNEKTIYAGTAKGGLFVTSDNADQWLHLDSLGTSVVLSFDIDHTIPCILYAGIKNTLYQSADCGRTWQSMLLEPPDSAVTAISTDPTDTQTLFVGTSEGDVLLSRNRGKSWDTVLRVRGSIGQIASPRDDPGTAYVVSSGSGLWKTTNYGAAWEDRTKPLKEFRNSLEDPILSVGHDAVTLHMSSSYGIIKSQDGAQTWKPLSLLTEHNTAAILALGLDPLQPNSVYYTTDATFYHSTNNGETWKTTKLPTTQLPTALVVHPKDSSILYLSVRPQ